MSQPIFYHCPKGVGGRSRREFRKLVETALVQMPRRSAPPQTVFVTYNNTDRLMLVERCYQRAGIEVVTLAKDYEPWNWMGKILPVRDFLRDSSNCFQYIVATDANDVLLAGDPAAITDRFLEYQCDLLFCNTMSNWPRSTICNDFESRTYRESKYHCHLSAGGFVGRTAVVLSCMETIIQAWTKRESWTVFRSGFDDQNAWRYLHMALHPQIKIDYRKRIFCRFDCRRLED